MASTTTSQTPEWRMKADYVETCNCEYGCPCNFNGFPTYGFCRGLILFHIRSGNYGTTKLDDLDVVMAASWPKAIHDGNGTGQIFITRKTDESQRQAILDIFSGQAKGQSPFAIIISTIKYLLDPQYVDINVKIDGKRSSFSISDVIDVQLEGFKNPVTGEEQETKIELPKGFIWNSADAAKTITMKMTTSSLNFDHSGKNAFYSVVEYKGP